MSVLDDIRDGKGLKPITNCFTCQNDNYEVIRKPKTMDRLPTFVCMICGEYDDPDANMVDTRPWICNRCAKKLKELLYGEV